MPVGRAANKLSVHSWRCCEHCSAACVLPGRVVSCGGQHLSLMLMVAVLAQQVSRSSIDSQLLPVLPTSVLERLAVGLPAWSQSWRSRREEGRCLGKQEWVWQS